MFKQKFSEEDFFNEYVANLEKIATAGDTVEIDNKRKAIENLKSAAKILKDHSFNKEAELVLMLSEDLEDPATDNLTPEKMLENYKSKGWPFNTDGKVKCKECNDSDDGCMHCVDVLTVEE